MSGVVTFKEIEQDFKIRALIEKSDEFLAALGYTEHSFVHVRRTAAVAKMVLEKLGYSERTQELAKIAGYLHDIGNVINRIDHAQSSALMAYQILSEKGMPATEIAYVISAIGNHDESTASPTPINEVAAALILADKTDVRRSRVRNTDSLSFDIHDRVNYAAVKSKFDIDEKQKLASLELEIDTSICPVMDYFEIFLQRMILCKSAASYLKTRFELTINGSKLL